MAAIDDDGPLMGPCETCGGSGIAARQEDPPSFTCPRCGAVSFNPNDIRERYCGRCHVFVDGDAA